MTLTNDARYTDLEKMDEFFNARADMYDSHMLDDLKLNEFYEAVSACFDRPVARLLDLGCGTGLELKRLFERFPDMEVTGIDMSEEMLNKLSIKFPDNKLTLICGSYFDEDFGNPYDAALSTYSLHHFTENIKLELYRKVFTALEPGGRFVLGDYTVATTEEQLGLIAEGEAKRRERGIPDGEFYHLDMPFTAETEIRLLMEAGFTSAEVVRQWENTSIIVARK